MSILVADTEVYQNFFYIGYKRLSDGLRVGFELSERSPKPDRARVRKIMMSNTNIGYNFAGFDNPLIWAFINGADNKRLKCLADGIINNKVRWWDAEKFCDVKIPRNCDTIDLMEPQPNAIAGLKSLIARMGGKWLQELPYQPDEILTPEMMDRVIEYNQYGDLDGTELLWKTMKEPMDLRLALGRQYDMDFRSKSDSQIGEAIVKKRVEQITGKKPEKAKARTGYTIKYNIPDFLHFKHPHLVEILDRLRTTEFYVNAKGKVNLPTWLIGKTKKREISLFDGNGNVIFDPANDDEAGPGLGLIPIGKTIYKMGIGGLHSTESNRAVHSDANYVLIDADVASMYPTLILLLKLLPPALGEAFWIGYAGIKGDRLKAKKRGKEIKEAMKDDGRTEAELHKLLGELLACEVVDKGLKIALNGVFGKLGSIWSILFAPELLLAVTLTGQLSLLMLIEWAEEAGIEVVSGNTDGVLFKCPRSMFNGFAVKDAKKTDRLAPGPLEAICSAWEKATGMDLEFQEYKAIYNQSVNSYFAIKADGGHKRKGPIANPWSDHPDDRDPRGQLMKNPQSTICSDAALALIKYGTPIEKTIRDCMDIRQFVTVIKATGGATWRDQYLGKVVRYYYSTDGDPMFKAVPNDSGNYPMVPKTEGSAPCMILPDEFPDDIDYRRYIYETEQLLMDIGAVWRPPVLKKVSTNQRSRKLILNDYLSAMRAAA
ncbi:hypothetical protein AEAC466_04580 [Asticcacaulis sp. AC466]|uniref:hypothetical protein n=1 Tax=Asticcacaulis sp. AC466 TaxID=1282362 RepID=UPI0003C402D3|nr:hypothetical protein [Asticcacaulis sp. AC466]ESQ85445.1 hypothetical protein AEAC466_04580 [Asticcacaulis sp. AC466]